VGVPGSEDGGAAEELQELVVGRRRLDPLDARRGGSMDAEQAAALAELDLVRRDEARRASRRSSRHDRTAEVADAVDAVFGLRPALGEVAEIDEPIDLGALELGDHGVEADAVPVDVREETDAHHAPVRPRWSRSASCSASANSARSSAIVGRTATAGTIGSQKLKTR
jgi:hypothetical protein